MFKQLRKEVRKYRNFIDKTIYTIKGKKPWSRGYSLKKFEFIVKVFKSDYFMSKFKAAEILPDGYGYAFDERVIEYPWTLSRISSADGRLLDAGSCFNFPEIIESPKIAKKNLTIFTLAPEWNAYWQRGISYHYGDLRSLPFKDNWFDEVCSLSTLGHVGMDNRLYTKSEIIDKVSLEAEVAAKELLRVLRPEGKLLISVVFGKRQTIEWDGTAFAEQFDSFLLRDLLKSFASCSAISVFFYKYTKSGWNVSTEKECQNIEYFNIHTAKSLDPDYAAAARSVALIEVIK